MEIKNIGFSVVGDCAGASVGRNRDAVVNMPLYELRRRKKKVLAVVGVHWRRAMDCDDRESLS